MKTADKASGSAEAVEDYAKVQAINEVEVQRIQGMISDIIRTNNGFKTMHEKQVEEIKRIREQALIHKRILTELQDAKGDRKIPRISDASEILRQEKIRIIDEETRKGRNRLKSIAGSGEGEGSGDTEQKEG
ncbi:MAG: hypothetical protein Q8R76_02045 [Candidatus Omnitrophota bacterium]|nr:hypothetical protein [Candidatus Omnitrophota bacterium]